MTLSMAVGSRMNKVVQSLEEKEKNKNYNKLETVSGVPWCQSLLYKHEASWQRPAAKKPKASLSLGP